ncbi:MAG: hypothetical protein LC789_00350 [Actinobacteria bacterium]|nr:hypothetical protein [Actinomycetota bacterium]MCA1719671.1 hypothetical protein [Actinomycetota bacterium]
MRPLLVLAACALAAGCTSGSSGSSGPKQPPVSAFTDGTCRVIAPDVLSIGRDARAVEVGVGTKVAPATLMRLEEAQSRLRPLVEGAEPAYQPALDKLVVAVGLVRLQARVGGVKAPTRDNLLQSYQALVDVCTRPA